MNDLDLLLKYNVPVPRYTSYPTVLHWRDEINTSDWLQRIASNSAEGMALYLHLPFCETLCTYCGCNKKITKNHGVEGEYIEAILKEWQLYRDQMPGPPVIRELHLGGGTPTFFSPSNLEKILATIFKSAEKHPDHEFSFEGHPNNTTREHLEMLYELGFRRVSFGVQDNDPEVQRVINRMQPFKNVELVTTTARELGYQSVNFDLIYGLPLQNEEKMERTLGECIGLRPDRVAFYSYAHVPWTSRAQRLFDESHLPSPKLKMKLYSLGRKMFAQAGYQDVGMDHFALPSDELIIASQSGRLHRNFMGYTVRPSGKMLGLGVSAISDAGDGYMQNKKSLAAYYQDIDENKLPLERGYILNEDDFKRRQMILDISCRAMARLDTLDVTELQRIMPSLQELEDDELVQVEFPLLKVTQPGKNFIRNICSVFDSYLRKEERGYSKAV